MRVLVTGVAGFIGFHVAKTLLKEGHEVIGVDNLNNYYEVSLKEARLGLLRDQPGFTFHKINIADHVAMMAFSQSKLTHIIHLAAQAGVRYSLENPFAYVESNLTGQVSMLELARYCDGLEHFVYASSSSVYGGNTKIPFSVEDSVKKPISLYAATKRADELMGYTYAHLFKIPMTGLRFFTVYGPWGRPDMAAYLFAKAIEASEPIKVFNHGKMRRDFTYIDDVVKGVLASLSRIPQADGDEVPSALYNLGNSHAEDLMHFIAVMEKALGKKAHIDFQPLQPGDVPETFADIASSTRDFGFKPEVGIDVGVLKFVEWFRDYHKA